MPAVGSENHREEGTRFSGSARVFGSEEEAQARINDGTVVAGDVVVIRYEGPGRPRHARNAHAHLGHRGRGLGNDVPITDGRFSGGGHGLWWACPAGSVRRRPLALVEDADPITIDAEADTIDVHISDDDDAAARPGSSLRRYRGVLAKYAGYRLASTGAVTDQSNLSG